MTINDANVKALLDLMRNYRRGYCLGGFLVLVPSGETPQGFPYDARMFVEYGPSKTDDREPLDPSWYPPSLLNALPQLERTENEYAAGVMTWRLSTEAKA